MKKSTLFPLYRKLGLQRALNKVLVILFLLVGINGYAQPGANVVIIPTDTIVQNGQTFTARIRIEVFSGQVGGAEVHLDFDPTYLQVTAIATSAGNPLTFAVLPFDPIATINANGHVQYGAGDPGAPFATDTFDFVDVTFQAIAIPPGNITPLTFTTTAPEITQVTDDLGIPVLDRIINGRVAIHPLGCTVPTATISTPGGTTTCSYNLILSGATGGTDYDLVINGTTYNNVTVGSTITPFTVPEERVFGLAAPAPVPPSFNDAAPITGTEIGVNFTASQDGFIKGIRFWTPNPVFLAGTYTGNLWTAGGVNLVSAPFTAVVANSWAEVYFTTPVAITAGTTYVASVYSDESSYTATANYFTTDVTVGSITMPAAGNGVFAFNVPVSTFPNTPSGNSSNYWVDVIYSPEVSVFNLSSITTNAGCFNFADSLQTLSVTSVNCSTLPVSLLGLSATAEGKDITLRWSTVSELNNLGFEVQRRTDGSTDWTALAFVNGAGNSSSLLKYTYVDRGLASQRYYYRLKQIDIDQKFIHSPIVSAIINGKENFSLDQNFPNPFRNETALRFTLPRAAKVNLSLFDMNGKLVKVILNESRQSGTHVVNLSAAALRSGVYFYKIQAGEFTEVKKLTIQ